MGNIYKWEEGRIVEVPVAECTKGEEIVAWWVGSWYATKLFTADALDALAAKIDEEFNK